MRALLVLMVALLAVLGLYVYLFGNPLDAVRNQTAEQGEMRDVPVTEPPAVVVASGTVTDATTPSVAPASEPAKVEQEARQFVQTLTEPTPEPVSAEQADHFVSPDQMISMVPEANIETTTLRELKADPSLHPDTPITVVRTIEQIEASTPERVIAESEGNLDAPIKVLDSDNEVRETTVREVLEQHKLEPLKPIMVVREVEHYEITTLAELEKEMEREAPATATGPAPATTPRIVISGAAQAGDPASTGAAGSAGTGVTPAPIERTIRVIREPYTVSRATIAEILESRNEKVEEGSIFYVRTVRDGDAQGIWGIVHQGILQNFARGVALRRGEELNTYKVDIPPDADELEQDRSSSFLGRLIFDKSRESHVYNYRLNRMGESPDRIYPGQELVIIQFRAEELVSIYRHFVEQQG